VTDHDDRRAPQDPLTRLIDELNDLRIRAGDLSTRDIARATRNKISHTTVHKVLRKSNAAPPWDQVEAIVGALRGDVEFFRDLWIKARTHNYAPTPSGRSAVGLDDMELGSEFGSIEKKYQVFVSSTSVDLEDERRTVIDSLLESAYIPVGMELFKATSEAAWPTIETLIDACDYYVVIIGGRYGTMRKLEDASFTESEYSYAKSQGKPILAFIRKNLQISDGEDAAAFERTLKFRDRLQAAHHCKYWKDKDELARQVIIGLHGEVQKHPQTGWIRANTVDPLLAANLVSPCRELGIHRVSASGEAGIAMHHNIEKSRSLSVIATSGLRVVEVQHKSMAKAVTSGCRIRWLVPERDSPFVADVEESERRPQGDSISVEIDSVQARLQEVVDRAALRAAASGGPLGTVQIGFFPTHLRSTIIICDDSWAWLTVTLPPIRATQTASFELVPTGQSPLIQDCLEHFNRTWDIVTKRGRVIDILPSRRE